MKKIILFSLCFVALFMIVNTTTGCKKDKTPTPTPTPGLDTVSAMKGKLFINEIFSKSNAATPINDWVELYNSSDSTLKLTTAYSITDSFGWNNKFLLTKDYYIAPKSFFVIECDGLNECSDAIHSSFKLSSTGEQFGIYNAGAIIDSVSFPDMSVGDISYGRTTNGGSTWSTFTSPTKGTSNN